MSNPLEELRRINVAGQKSRAAADATPPVPVKESMDEASILQSNTLDSKDVSELDSKTANTLASKMLATEDKKTDGVSEKVLSLNELYTCALPTTDDAIKAFLVSTVRYKRIPCAFRWPESFDALVTRVLSGGSYDQVRKRYKQNIILRGIMLVLYEEYTGKKLVDFGVDLDEE